MLCQQSDRIGDRFKFPSLEYLYQFRVVICTFNTSGCFPRARDLNEKFNFSHFSHIFIDEAASVQMTVALIGIAGKYYFFIELLVELQSRLRFSCFVNLFFNYSIQCKYFFFQILLGLCTDIDGENSRVNASVILSGDPLQLEAVVKSKNAEKMGYKKSFMEFLFEKPLYCSTE